MAETTIVVLVLGAVLAIVTLVGHGIWMALAAVFGSRAHPAKRSPPGQADGHRACPRCLTPLGADYHGCSVCGWPQDVGQQADVHAGLAAVREQLNRYAWLGVLDESARSNLAATIHSEEELLAERKLAAQRAAIEAKAPAAAEPTAEPVAPITGESRVLGVPAAEAASPAGAPLAERARKYARSRGEAETLAEPLAPVIANSAAPAVPVSRLMSAFMEEKNIRWGELVGGLLIVGCSIALVISFWSEIAARPLLKFVLFNGVTAALFGAGLYTDRRWKIHTTSHGVLIIATLLVPLNFLAIAAFTQASPPTDVLSLAGEAASLVVFSLLVYFAGRILVSGDAPLLVVAVMVPSLMQLLVRRFAEPATPLPWLYALAGVPIASYVATVVLALHRMRATLGATGSASASSDVEANASNTLAEPVARTVETQAQRVLVFFGLASAATLLPLALLGYKVPPLEVTLQRLSPLVAVCGLPALLVALLFWRRASRGWGRATAGPQNVPADHLSAGLQTTGIGMGVLGALIMVGSVVLAWPEPAFLLPTALAVAAVMLAVAMWFEIPTAHVPAGVALAAAWLVVFYLLRGDIPWTLDDSGAMRRTLISATSGHALVPLVVIFGMMGAGLLRIGRRDDGLMYGLVAAATAAASLALVVWFGFGRAGDPANASWTLAIYAVVALAAGVTLNRADAARAGSALLFAALVQAIVYRFNPEWQLDEPWIAALLAHSGLVAILCGVLATFVARSLREPSAMTTAHRLDMLESLAWSAQITSLAAAVWIAAIAHQTSAGALGVNLAWLAGVWMLMTVLTASRLLFTLSQTALVLAILCGVTVAVETRPWYVAARHPWLDPWFLEAQGVALAAYCLALGAARGFVERAARQQADDVVELPAPNWLTTSYRLLNPPWPAVDHVLELGLVLLLVMIATYAALPGAAQELAPLEAARGSAPAVRVEPPLEQFVIAGIPPRHAADRWAWILFAAVSGMLAARLGQRGAEWRRSGLVLAVAMVCPLLAALWESQVAVASALRWLSAGLFAIASIAIWARSKKSATIDDCTDVSLATMNPPSARDVLVALVMLVYVAMGAYVAQAALQRADMPAATAWMWPYVGCWALVAAAAALAIPRLAARGSGGAAIYFDRNRAPLALPTRDALLLLGIAPLAILLTFTVARALDQHPIVGPHPESWFHRIGWDVSYGVPLAVIALVFIGYAIRDRSSRFAFSAGLLSNVVATIVVLMRLARGGGTLDAVAWITVAQVNAIVAGVAALAWLAALTYAYRESKDSFPASRPSLLVTQVVLAAALCAIFLLPAVVRVAAEPQAFTWVVAAGGILGWCAVALATAAAVWMRWRLSWSQTGVAVFVAALVGLVALSAARWDTGNWLAYHTLLAGCCVAAWLLPIATRAANRLLSDGAASTVLMLWSAPAARLFGLVAVLLAVWGYRSDPASPWWTLAALAAIGARAVWIAWHEARPAFVWLAALLFIPAASIFWLDWANQFSSITGVSELGQVAEFLCINVLAAGAVALASVWIEQRALRFAAMASAAHGSRIGVAFHRFAAWAIIATLLLTTGVGLIADLVGEPVQVTLPLVWAAWIAAAATALACWWDPAVRWPVACLYCVGLLAVGIYLDGLNFRAPMFQWALALALAAYSLATSTLWSCREKMWRIAQRWGLPSAAASGHGWLVSANILLGMVVLLLVSWIEATMPEFTQRMVAAYAVGAQAIAIGLLARGAVRTPLQYGALLWGVLFAVGFALALLPPDFPAVWLHRYVVTVVALAVAVVIYGFGLVKFLRRENEWTRAAARLVPPLSVIAVALIGAVLAIEVRAFIETGEVPIVMPALVAVGLALVGLAIAALIAALVPGRDPLGLSERGRTLYVYAAEALAALLFLHIRVTMPWLFRGWFLQFWPLVVMAIAFVGVGLGELFERRRQRVLSEPLQNTGVLLPLLPALGFWVVSSQVHYSLLLLSIGALYAAMSALRQSFLYGVLAAVAANGSLWFLLDEREGLGLFQHPQLWLIPPALCALAAGHINRARLTHQQSAALRYAAAMVIYVSSTADVFINGVANAPWLPAVLAGVSILGVFAGILLRVRAFLYLGTAFLVVAIMTVIWHAAIHNERTWILWVAGIITGALIIALFGVFEKRRDDVLRMVEQLRQWEA